MRRPIAWMERRLFAKSAAWIGPALAFAACFYCFGLLLSRLGYFQDDWHHVFYAYWQGAAGLRRFLLADRGPFAWTVYALFFNLLGYSPAAWHWSLMSIRFLTAAVFWLCMSRILPHQRTLTAWLCTVFIIYPVFTLQPLAVAYTLHWVMYLVFMLSLLAMLAAVRSRRGFAALTVLALILEGTQLAYIEYFAGLELCRPIFLWLLFAGEPAGERWKKALKYAAPYLMVLALFVVYRSSWAAIFGYDRFTPLATLLDVVRSPLAGIAGIAQSALQDLIYILLSQWVAAVDPAVIDLSRPSTFLILGSIVSFAALAYIWFVRTEPAEGEAHAGEGGAGVAAAGLVCVVLAMLPFWLAGFSIYQKNQLWSERLALAAMPGASMLLVGGVYALVEGNHHRFLILGTLFGLGVGMQVQIARNFQASWDKQEDFYWQLHWRAPALKPGTMLVSDQEILFYMGIYPTAFAINMLYPQSTTPPEASYWFNAGFEHVNFDRFAAGRPDTFEKYATTFTATAPHVVAITFDPGNDQCLWILGPQLANARALSSTAGTWLSVSNPSQIEAVPVTAPPIHVFGPEPPHTWCYYYESAALAAQYDDWRSVAQLWSEAQTRDLRSSNAIELLPFISGLAHLGRWEGAQSLTAEAQTLPDRSTSVLCDLWREIGTTAPPSPQRDKTTNVVESNLGCQQ